jgi:hypothetical protein
MVLSYIPIGLSQPHPLVHVVLPEDYIEGLAYCRNLAALGVIKVCFRLDDSVRMQAWLRQIG